ncbi:hypothetical protein ACSSWA_08110 [Melioribacter sp. Ez-97]
METLEHASKIEFIASQIGNIEELTESRVNELINRRNLYGIPKEIGIN